MRPNLIVSTSAIIGAALLFAACRKELDTPPEQTLPTGSVISLSQLRAMYTGTPVRFPDPMSVYCTVTADELNGNLYKEVYVQDDSAAINVRLLFSGGLYQGDRIRIYLPGTVLSAYNGMLQLDSVDVDNNTIKQETDVHVEPRLVNAADIDPSLQGMLIKLDSVQFVDGEQGMTYADAVNQVTENRTLEDCNNDQIIVRSSGYADFASMTLPVGRGPVTAVVGQFGSTMQLYIRNVNEVQLNGLRCDGSTGGPCPPAADVLEDFAGVVQYDPIGIACWKNVATSGGVVWEGGSFSGETFARCEAYQSGDPSNVMWLVGPAVQYTAGMTLSFRTEKAYWTHDPIAVLISTDFDGINTTSATWDPISCPRAGSSTTDYVWVPSGNVDLAPYLPIGYTGAFNVAFRYTGGDGGTPQTTRYDVDDVAIQ